MGRPAHQQPHCLVKKLSTRQRKPMKLLLSHTLLIHPVKKVQLSPKLPIHSMMFHSMLSAMLPPLKLLGLNLAKLPFSKSLTKDVPISKVHLLMIWLNLSKETRLLFSLNSPARAPLKSSAEISRTTLFSSSPKIRGIQNSDRQLQNCCQGIQGKNVVHLHRL